IATEYKRQAAFFEHTERRLEQPLAHACDVADVFLTRIAFVLCLWNRRHEIAAIDDRYAERRQAFPKARNAERRGAHVDAAAIATEVQRDADDVDRAQFDVTHNMLIVYHL